MSETNPTRNDMGGCVIDLADLRSWRNVRFQRAVVALRDLLADLMAERAGWEG